MSHNIFIHQHPQFAQLINIVAKNESIDPVLVEKDYWIMHCLYGLQQLNFKFELKGGTSLSKGYGIIKRFSEDIDIHIEPPQDFNIKTGKNHDKPSHIEGRRKFYDWLAKEININGICTVRDTEFDDKEKYRNGGIRLNYNSTSGAIPEDLKDGVLLEIGFDTTAPNTPKDISSWIYDYAEDKVVIVDNRALGVQCYDPGYTLVEKLQAISTKYRQQQEKDTLPQNFIRHYYDVYELLKVPVVQSFIGTPCYKKHKAERFRKGDNQTIAKNEAFLLNDVVTRKLYKNEYDKKPSLYYRGQPDFLEILELIAHWVQKL